MCAVLLFAFLCVALFPLCPLARVAIIDVCVLGNTSTVFQRFRGLWKHINWLKSFTLLNILHKFLIEIIYRKWLSMTRVKDINIQLFQFIYAFVKVFKIIDITETCEIVN